MTTNIQPVVPISLSEDWNLITRTIIPVIWQNDIAGNSGDQFGLGDTKMALWLSPTKSTNGITWGVGPQLNLPTSTDSLLGPGEFGAGLTAVGLAQPGPWTVGGLASHTWSVDGDAINATFVQPFLAYSTEDAWTFTINSESTYDWNGGDWSIPANFMISKLVSISGQRVSFQAGARYYLASSSSGADGWGARFAVTFVFPKK